MEINFNALNNAGNDLENIGRKIMRTSEALEDITSELRRNISFTDQVKIPELASSTLRLGKNFLAMSETIKDVSEIYVQTEKKILEENDLGFIRTERYKPEINIIPGIKLLDYTTVLLRWEDTIRRWGKPLISSYKNILLSMQKNNKGV